MKSKFCALAVFALAAFALPVQAAGNEEAIIFKEPTGKGPVEWGKYLQDSSAGSVTAAGMLGISGDSIATVENVRDVVVALKGFNDNESKATLAISVTPARTELLPMSYAFYRKEGIVAQLLGSFTVGYAQGDAEIAATKYERQAVSAETSFFFSPLEDDPVLAFGDRLEKTYTPKKDKDGKEIMGDVCDIERDPEVVKARAAVGGGAASEDQDDSNVGSLGISSSNPLAKAKSDPTAKCYKAVMDGLRWNRSRASIATATGWIKGKEGGVEEKSLGTTIVAGVTYGISDSWALSGTYRYTFDEPILETLGTATVEKKDTSLIVGQLKYGSKKFRVLAEASNAKQRNDGVTASSTTFRQAVGVDFRLLEATWLNFRYGRQHEVSSSGDNYGALFTFSYSPSALLH